MRLKKKPVESVFELDSSFGKFSVTIKQVRVGDDIKRAELMATSSLVINDQLFGQEIKQKLNQEELRRYEVYLTLVDCDLEAEDDDGNIIGPWFKFVNHRLVSQADFETAYNSLPSEIAKLIQEKVREVNFTWKPNSEEDEGE